MRRPERSGSGRSSGALGIELLVVEESAAVMRGGGESGGRVIRLGSAAIVRATASCAASLGARHHSTRPVGGWRVISMRSWSVARGLVSNAGEEAVIAA